MTYRNLEKSRRRVRRHFILWKDYPAKLLMGSTKEKAAGATFFEDWVAGGGVIRVEERFGLSWVVWVKN